MNRLDGVDPVDVRKHRPCAILNWIGTLTDDEVDTLASWCADRDRPISQIHRVCEDRLGFGASYEPLRQHVNGICRCPDDTPLRGLRS